jgi:hypothetical protein
MICTKNQPQKIIQKMRGAKKQPKKSAIELLKQPHIHDWILCNKDFLLGDEDAFFKNITAKNAIMKPRENNWAWKLFNLAVPWANPFRKGMWSGDWAERIFREIVPNGWVPEKVGGHQLDWEDENFVYEVKTQFHWGGGTAQDKILGTPVKYSQIPKLTGKTLIIVCFGAAETLTRAVLERDCPEMRDQIALWKSWGIEFRWGSDLIKDLSR